MSKCLDTKFNMGGGVADGVWNALFRVCFRILLKRGQTNFKGGGNSILNIGKPIAKGDTCMSILRGVKTPPGPPEIYPVSWFGNGHHSVDLFYPFLQRTKGCT